MMKGLLLNINFKKLDDTAQIPQNAYEGDAGVDLRSIEDVEIQPFERRLIATGLSMELPDGYAGFVLPRSGNALKKGLSLANTPGLVDSNYRGELKVAAINLDPHAPIAIHKGDRIAQLVVMRVEQVHPVQVDALSDSQRGDGGFGSSGVE